MNILKAAMVPHPPLIIPEVGRGEEKKIQPTIDAYAAAARSIADADPDTIVITSPHSVMYSDYFHISPGKAASGSFADFRAEGVRISVNYDDEFVDTLCGICASNGFPAGTEGERDARLDHATMIPLWFLQRAYGEKPLPQIVRIGLSGLPLTDHYRLGMFIREAAEKLSRRVCVVASGDLSHQLKSDGPYGFNKNGPVYDERIMRVMGEGDLGQLMDFSEEFCDSAGECGHRSFTIMAGCFDGYAVEAKKLSYEGPFGVGYGVCVFTPGAKDASRRFYEAAAAKRNGEAALRRSNEDEYVRLARASVETYVRTGRRANVPDGLPQELLEKRAGAFVSLHINGRLRGCIGTTGPTTDCLAQEIIQNGVSACSRDPRFPAVRVSELESLEYSVDVLAEPEDIASEDELDVKKYGVIVSDGYRRGLLLPDLEGVDSVAEQIAIARQKAGIGPHEKINLQRFEVVRHV